MRFSRISNEETRMRLGNRLFLYQEVMLLSLKDEKGTVERGAYYKTAIGAAILAELLLSERVEIQQAKKKQFARVINGTRLDDPLLDECLQRIEASKKRQQLRTWVSRFANTKNLLHRVAMGLCRLGVLRVAEDKVLLVFKRRVYPEINPKPEQEIVARLKKAIFGSGLVDPQTGTLIAIAQSTNLLKNALEKKELKERKERIKSITSGDSMGKAAKEVVQAAQAAAAMVVITTTTT
jgi:Golgi phosphoprotein 3